MPVLDDFQGDWLIDRRIEDRAAEQAGRFHGTASFTPGASGLAYREEGVLRLGGAAPVEATQRYTWTEDGPLIAVSFSDGRAFHSFDPGLAGPEASHACAPDDYAVRYDFLHWPLWEAVWTVRGPRKDYTMTSRYRRAT